MGYLNSLCTLLLLPCFTWMSSRCPTNPIPCGCSCSRIIWGGSPTSLTFYLRSWAALPAAALLEVSLPGLDATCLGQLAVGTAVQILAWLYGEGWRVCCTLRGCEQCILCLLLDAVREELKTNSGSVQSSAWQQLASALPCGAVLARSCPAVVACGLGA